MEYNTRMKLSTVIPNGQECCMILQEADGKHWNEMYCYSVLLFGIIISGYILMALYYELISPFIISNLASLWDRRSSYKLVIYQYCGDFLFLIMSKFYQINMFVQ